MQREADVYEEEPVAKPSIPIPILLRDSPPYVTSSDALVICDFPFIISATNDNLPTPPAFRRV
jgi:hypothetical protein